MKLTTAVVMRLGLAMALVVTTQLVVAHVKRTDHDRARNAIVVNAPDLPFELREWTGTAVEPDPKLVTALGSVTMADRVYIDREGRSATVHVSSFSIEELSLPHPPQICYPSAGWQIHSDEWKNQQTDHPFKLMVVEQGGTRAAVAYWYQLGPYVAGNRNELRSAFQKIRHESKWPQLVKVLVQTSIRDNESEAQAALENLSAQVYEWIKVQSAGK
jgi:Protein of unknown function (DUF3485)